MILQFFFFPGCQGAPAQQESPSSPMLGSVLSQTRYLESADCVWRRWSSLLFYALIIYAVHQPQDDKNTWNQWHFQGNVIFVRDGDYYSSENSKLDWTRSTKEQGKSEMPETKLIYIWDKLASICIYIQDLLTLLCSFFNSHYKQRCDCLIFFHELELLKHLFCLRSG